MEKNWAAVTEEHHSCRQESQFRAVELLGKIGLAAIENSSASACTDALDASLTFRKSDNTSSDPKDKAPMPLRQRSTENDEWRVNCFFPSVCRVSRTSTRRHALPPSRTCQQRLLRSVRVSPKSTSRTLFLHLGSPHAAVLSSGI